MPSPMPLAPPVMNAVLPATSVMSSSSSRSLIGREGARAAAAGVKFIVGAGYSR